MNNLMLYVILIGVPILLGLWAQFRVKRAFRHYSGERTSSNMSGADAARAILQAAQIRDVDVVEINDMLGDHYDPAHKRLCLSTDVYRQPSIAAVGIAAHEVGHAIQDARSYAPLKARMAVVPMTMIVSQILPWILIGSFLIPLIPWPLAVKAIAICYAVLAVFQLITLPVEFDASRRAKIVLREMGIVRSTDEAAGVNRVLNAAALTYVAAFVATLGALVYYLLAAQQRR
jgi:Zn-dependent membrane protease YugP